MSSIGFGSNEVKGEEYKGNSSEDFSHVVRLFGIKIFSSTKQHTTTTNTEGRNPNR